MQYKGTAPTTHSISSKKKRERKKRKKMISWSKPLKQKDKMDLRKLLRIMWKDNFAKLFANPKF